MKISILLLIGIACLWFFGRTQPIIVVEQTSSSERQVACSKCGGSGLAQIQATCPKCKGAGKGEWYFKSQSKEKLSGSKPVCIDCRGTGKILRREKCPPCGGSGRVAASESQKIKTVRADLSLWEKILLWMRFEPDKNCRPQRKMDGSYPLIVKYIETTVNPAFNARVVRWEPARLEGGEWLVQTEIEFKDKSGQWAQEGREFIIANREVIRSQRSEIRGQESEVRPSTVDSPQPTVDPEP